MLKKVTLSSSMWSFIITQPPQSPDLNVNDLGLFRSLKYRVENLKDGATTMDELYDSVLECYRQIIRCRCGSVSLLVAFLNLYRRLSHHFGRLTSEDLCPEP
jgi:hypothetical protein